MSERLKGGTCVEDIFSWGARPWPRSSAQHWASRCWASRPRRATDRQPLPRAGRRRARRGATPIAGALGQRHDDTARASCEFAGREFLTDAELAERTHEVATRAEKRPTSAAADVELAYNNEWWERGSPLKRTSLIIDPPDGRLPALTDEGKKIVAARDATGKAAARRTRGRIGRCRSAAFSTTVFRRFRRATTT